MNGGILTTHNLAEKGKKGSVGKTEEESACDKDHEREPKNSGITGGSEHRRRRETFVLNYLSV
jgi:hypothetical protein